VSVFDLVPMFGREWKRDGAGCTIYTACFQYDTQISFSTVFHNYKSNRVTCSHHFATTLDLTVVVVDGNVYILCAFFISIIIILDPTEHATKRD